jgi:hypothetical protein
VTAPPKNWHEKCIIRDQKKPLGRKRIIRFRFFGECNWFVTFNTDVRHWHDCRKLVHELECLSNKDFKQPMDGWYPNTEEWTTLMDKYAVLLSDYLQRRFETFMKAFFCDICGVQEKQPADYTKSRNRSSPDNSWYWCRVEWTETRGLPHFHCLVKLPHVLDVSLLGRLVQNGRIARQELKCGNILTDKMDEAWEAIEIGLLAQQYAINYVESLSMVSFYSEDMPNGVHNEEKVINLDELTEEFVKNYKAGNINCETHPVMRTPLMQGKCDGNIYVEIAKIAAISQIHQCLANACGGDEKGKGCRFDYPKQNRKKSVIAMIKINSEQCEARVLLRRTHERVNNIHPMIAYYWRANHDSTAIIDAAHSKRYCTKYASKSSKHSEMYEELLEHLNKRGLENLSNNVRHVLVQTSLASCSHRTFMSKMEVAYRVMLLPMILGLFSLE